MANGKRKDAGPTPDEAKGRRSPREILAAPPPGGAGAPVVLWFDGHPEAAEFAREWRRMKAAGETDWSLRRLLRYLREELDFPFHTRDALERWFAKQEQQ